MNTVSESVIHSRWIERQSENFLDLGAKLAATGSDLPAPGLGLGPSEDCENLSFGIPEANCTSLQREAVRFAPDTIQ